MSGFTTARWISRPVGRICCAAAVLAGAALATARFQDRGGARQRPGEIPLGEWSGRGVFIYQHWDDDEGPAADDLFQTSDDVVDLLEDDGAAGAKGRIVHRRYKTSLEVWTEEWEDRDVTVMEIRSRRGKLAELGEESHLLLAFEEARRLSRATVLYRMVAFSFNPDRDAELNVDESASPVTASCTTNGDVTVLQIHYMDNFTDTLRFEGRRVEKVGMYHTRDGMVHWNEELKQR